MSKDKIELIINDKKIEKQIARCDRIINSEGYTNETKASNYRRKADALKKIKKPSDEIKKEIENCFKMAAELNPDKQALYLTNLIDFLSSSDNVEAAVQNIATINKTKHELNDVEKSYVNNKVVEVKKLHKGIKQIELDVEKGKLTRESGNLQIKHLKATINHGERLNEHDERFSAVEKRLNKHDKKFSSVEKQLETVKTQQEIDREQIQTISDQVKTINDKLEKTGINDKVKIKEQIERLDSFEYEGKINSELNQSLKVYANSFYWTTVNKILAYRVLGTQNIEGQVWENTAGKLLESASSKITKICSTICGYVPFYGNCGTAVFESIDIVSSIVLEVMRSYSNAKNKKMVKLVNHELFFGRDMLKIDPENLINEGLLSGAIEIARGKSNIINEAISDPTPQEPIAGILKQTRNIKNLFIKKVIDPIIVTLYEVNAVRLNEVQKLAIADSALFMTWLVNQRSGKQEEEAFTKEINSSLEFGQKLANLYSEGGEIDQMLNAPAFEKNIKAYVKSIKKCINGIKETIAEARVLVSDIPVTADNIREYGKDEIKDNIIESVKGSRLYYIFKKIKTMTNHENKEVYEQDNDNTDVTDINYDDNLSSQSNILSSIDELTGWSEDTSNDSVLMGGE